MANGAPVEKVGGPKDKGPWPQDLEEISEGYVATRAVEIDGETVDRDVTITHVQHPTDRATGEEKEGYAVGYIVSGGSQ